MLIRTLLIFISSLALLASEPGLAVRFSVSQQGRGLGAGFSTPSNERPPVSATTSTSSTSSAVKIIPFAAFHIPTNQSPSSFLQPAPFTAEITGVVSVDLRAQHTFTIELTGKAELLLNGKEILNTPESADETNHTSTPIRLSKGPNEILIRYTSPTNPHIPATFRLLWSSKNSAVPIPIPDTALTHNPSPELTQSISRRNGAFLFQQYQCGKCHTPEKQIESPFDAPSFAGIGSRLNHDYIAAKILNPGADRPSRMPKIFHDADSEQKARAIAAYLASLTTNTPPLKTAFPAAGATLIVDLNCRACHSLPGEPASTNRIGLAHVPKKFQPAALVAYLQNPQAHYPGNPMPNFKLGRTEAESIAAFLLKNSARATTEPDAKLAARGKELVQNSGCLNCHSLDLPNQFKAPATAQLFAAKSTDGCLAPDSPRAPQFSFTDSDRSDLATFLAASKTSDPITLNPADFAVRATESLRCDQCHSDNHLPAPLTLGGKLKPEWTAHFIAGGNLEKPRPWLKARMPAFPAYATNLAAGLAALHGYPAHTPAEPSSSADLIKTGETLIGSTGGFSCVACHAVGANSVQLVVESPGVNLAYSGDRLLHSFFVRWLMNPIAIDPSTKMPAYFDAEGRSQLTEHFDGDARKQIDAMWAYIRSLSK